MAMGAPVSLSTARSSSSPLPAARAAAVIPSPTSSKASRGGDQGPKFRPEEDRGQNGQIVEKVGGMAELSSPGAEKLPCSRPVLPSHDPSYNHIMGMAFPPKVDAFAES